MRFRTPLMLLSLTLIVGGCSDNLSSLNESTQDGLSKAGANSALCAKRTNNSVDKLLECVTLDGVRVHQAAFQDIADANGGTRNFGTPGYAQSVDYVAGQLNAAGYDVTIQEFSVDTWARVGPSTLAKQAPSTVTYAESVDYSVMTFSPFANVTSPVTAVDVSLADPSLSTSGCEPADFAGFPAGHIALIQRGACAFSLKAENAAAAGAVGALIFNQGNSPFRTDLFTGTLGALYSGGIPVFSASFGQGVEWSGTDGLVLNMFSNTSRGEIPTSNVIAETSGGDASNTVMVGAHLDGVPAGPAIQDNGSGSAAILETAIQMAKVKPRNKVRFAWWGAEELGLLGSNHYVSSLSSSEIEDIALYLNFDMIASPNYVYFIYDGDDSDGVGAGPGPEGSAQIESTFESYYDNAGLPYKGSDFSGRSDYLAFINEGIPAGGLFTGAEGVKTTDEAAIWGGSAGDQYDPCYHLACDTFDNVSLSALDVNSDAVAFATLSFAMSTEIVNGVKGKGAFGPATDEHDAVE